MRDFEFLQQIKAASKQPVEQRGVGDSRPYGTHPDLWSIVWSWLPSPKEVWVWMCCIVVSWKLFLNHLWPRLLQIGLRQLGVQLGERAPAFRQRRRAERVRMSKLQKEESGPDQEDDASQDDTDDETSPWPPRGVSRANRELDTK